MWPCGLADARLSDHEPLPTNVADTRPQGIVEDWIVRNVLPSRYARLFTKRVVPLTWGGSFEFDAVSDDGKIVVCVSTSCCRTAGGRPAVGKYHKIRADTLYLLNARGTERRVLVFTDPGMFTHFRAEQKRGRFPEASAIELECVEIPPELAAALLKATQIASVEVSPTSKNR